jgi:hypothetical protein
VLSDVGIKTKKQLENAMTLFKELMLRRRKKILNLVLIAAEIGISKQDFNNMLLIEKDLFEDLMKCMDLSDKKLNECLNGGESDGTGNRRGQGRWPLKTERSHVVLPVLSFKGFLCFQELQVQRGSLGPMSTWLLANQFAKRGKGQRRRTLRIWVT